MQHAKNTCAETIQFSLKSQRECFYVAQADPKGGAPLPPATSRADGPLYEVGASSYGKSWIRP